MSLNHKLFRVSFICGIDTKTIQSLDPRLTWSSTEQMLNDSKRTGSVDKCGEDYQSVNIYITFHVGVIFCKCARSSPTRRRDSDFRQRRSLAMGVFFFVRCVGGVGGMRRVLSGVYSHSRQSAALSLRSLWETTLWKKKGSLKVPVLGFRCDSGLVNIQRANILIPAGIIVEGNMFF